MTSLLSKTNMNQIIKVAEDFVIESSEQPKQSKKELIESLQDKGLSEYMIATIIHERGYLVDD